MESDARSFTETMTHEPRTMNDERTFRIPISDPCSFSFARIYICLGNKTMEDGKVDILANEAGERVTATVVSLINNEQVVGSVAGATSYSLASVTVRNNKSLLDVDVTEEVLSDLTAQSAVKISKSSDGEISYTINIEGEKKPVVFTPLQIAFSIFKKLLGIASSAATGQKTLSCVITVPVDWSRASRQRVVEAATQAKWNVLQVVNEPAAALLAYEIGFETPPVDCISLVYRLGGTSCDATVIKLERGFQRILSYVRTNLVGGKRIIKALATHLGQEFQKKYHLDPNESRKSLWKLSTGATLLLHNLSTLPSASTFLESVCYDTDFAATVSRARLDALLSPILPELTDVIIRALDGASVTTRDVSKVVLCGGTLKVPKIRSAIQSMFDCEVLCSIGPDEVVALGAARQASLIASLTIRDFDVLESKKRLAFLKGPLTIKVDGSEVSFKNEPLPAVKQLGLITERKDVEVEVEQTCDSVSRKTCGILNCKDPGPLDCKFYVNLSSGVVAEATNQDSSESSKIELVFAA